MDGKIPIGVPAGLTGLDVEAGEVEAVHGEARDVLIGHAQTHRHTVEGTPGAHCAHELVDLFRPQESQGKQPLQLSLQIGHFLRNELELIGGLIARHDLAVAVEDEPAGRGYGLGSHPVALRELGVIVVAQDLQRVQAGKQSKRRQEDQHARDQRALIEEALLSPVILDAYAGSHVRYFRSSVRSGASGRRPRRARWRRRSACEASAWAK